MHLSRTLHHSCRTVAYLSLFALLTLTGLRQVNGQSPTLRIGLQTGRAEARLQGSVPVRVNVPGAAALDIPENQTIIFTVQDGGVVIADADGVELQRSSAPVQVVANPAPTPDTPPTPPLIRLLGPTRHYDGKADRPYRGSFEIIPRADGLTVVNCVDIESYLRGVVSSEMSPGYPLEALKAQAVAARTYALKNIGHYAAQGYDLDDTARCQVYGGYFSEDARTTRAVEETTGHVLLYQGALIDAVYSSTCGGITESAKDAWGHPVPYLVSVSDFPEDAPAAVAYPKSELDWSAFLKVARDTNCLQPKYAKPEAFRWTKIMTRQEIEAQLPAAYQVGTLQEIVPLRRGASGRIFSLKLVGSTRTVTIEQELPIRNALGKLRSSAFTVDTYRDEHGTPVVFAFWGAGWGHGLGMCQVGAVGLATQGWTYDTILAHYYQGTTLERQE